MLASLIVAIIRRHHETGFNISQETTTSRSTFIKRRIKVQIHQRQQQMIGMLQSKNEKIYLAHVDEILSAHGARSNIESLAVIYLGEKPNKK